MKQFCVLLLALVCLSGPMYAQTSKVGYIKQGDGNLERHDQVIVFVHGLSPFGDDNAVSTWTADGVYWPEKAATDDVFRDVDIFVASYDSDAWDSNSFASVARSLREQLLREGIDEYSRIFFVAHSLGGVAVRQVLLDTPELSNKTDALFMFAVPQNGSVLADIARYVTGRWAGFYGDGRVLIDTLTAAGAREDDSPISRLKSDWIRKRMNIPTYCGYETEEYGGFPNVLIVPRTSAEALCTHDLIAFERDHATIVHAMTDPGPREIADPHRVLRAWYSDALEVAGFREGAEKYDERDVIIANCPGDQEYSISVVENIRDIVFSNDGVLVSGVSRAMPQVWQSSGYPRYLWSERPPKFIVMHYSCFEGRSGNITVRDGNFSEFAKEVLAAGVNLVSYSRTFNNDVRLDYICRHLNSSSVLSAQTDTARIFMYPAQDGTIIGGQDVGVNRAFGTAISDIFQGGGEEYLANVQCP